MTEQPLTKKTVAKNQTEVTVPASHFIQEDSAPAIGRAVADWMKANSL